MSAVREEIAQKALSCIDEVYPASDGLNASFFPVDQFMDEAARWVIKSVPIRSLGNGVELKGQLTPNIDGSGSMLLPDNFVRLIRFRIKGWHRPVITPIYDTDSRYVQQFNKTLRGGEAKPVVVICDNSGRLEYYSSSMGIAAKLEEARYFGFTVVDDNYPKRLVDITAWKVAELVLTTMGDTTQMQLCSAKIAEILQTL